MVAKKALSVAHTRDIMTHDKRNVEKTMNDYQREYIGEIVEAIAGIRESMADYAAQKHDAATVIKHDGGTCDIIERCVKGLNENEGR